MRLWSFSPAHLQPADLRTVWKDGLKALRLLKGERIGRTHHHQLQRWQEHPDPVNALATYLRWIWWSGSFRGIRFDRNLIGPFTELQLGALTVTQGQLEAEWRLYLARLRHRDIQAWEARRYTDPRHHLLFKVIPSAKLEPWEREVAA